MHVNPCPSDPNVVFKLLSKYVLNVLNYMQFSQTKMRGEGVRCESAHILLYSINMNCNPP